MILEASAIEALIRKSFPNAQIQVSDVAGDGRHYAATVVDESFRDKTRVEQQRVVYAALKEYIDGPNAPLHALALSTHAPQ